MVKIGNGIFPVYFCVLISYQFFQTCDFKLRILVLQIVGPQFDVEESDRKSGAARKCHHYYVIMSECHISKIIVSSFYTLAVFLV